MDLPGIYKPPIFSPNSSGPKASNFWFYLEVSVLMASLYSFIPCVFKTDTARVLPCPGVQEPEWIISWANNENFNIQTSILWEKQELRITVQHDQCELQKLPFSLTVQSLAEESIEYLHFKEDLRCLLHQTVFFATKNSVVLV